MVKDITPGPASSTPLQLTEHNGQAFFQVQIGSSFELWKSDGTASGTVPIKAGVQALEPVSVGAFLFFVDAQNQLWRSDGTSTGTFAIDSIGKRLGNNTARLVDVNGVLYFSSDLGGTGYELWKSDGTVAGTVLVQDIRVGAASSDPRYLTNANGSLYFVANDGIHGIELWFLDPSSTPTGPGDYDADGDVDGADFLNWQRGLGSTVTVPGLGADGDGDGTVDVGDLAVWQARFSQTSAVAAIAPPETDRLSSEAVDSIFAGGDFTVLFGDAPNSNRPSWRPWRR
jgi:ELWxxDGT repeat protein